MRGVSSGIVRVRISRPRTASCPACGRALPAVRRWGGSGLCGRCTLQVPWIDGPVCPRCGKPARRTPGTEDVGPCADCRGRPVPFTASRAPAVYDGLWKELVHQLKFSGRRELAATLGGAMAAVAQKTGMACRVDVLVPVPVHPDRLMRRGFNQAAELAIHVGERAGIPVVHALGRPKPARVAVAGAGTPTSLQGARERRKSLRGAFTAWQPALVRGLTVMVVDDVYTTGATMDEAARTLVRAGCREVFGLVAAVGLSDRDLARAGPDRSEGA